MPERDTTRAPVSPMVGRIALLVGVLAVLLTGCGGSGSTATPAGATPEATGALVIVDVRTPAEYADGHADGSVNVDVQASDFDERIAELPKDGAYLVYCRSGNRSAKAVGRMRALGFTAVEDGGGLDDMKAAGYPFAG